MKKLKRSVVGDSGMKMVLCIRVVSAVLRLPLSLIEWRIQATATRYGSLFLLMQAQSIHVVVFAACSCATFWHRRRRGAATQELTFVVAGSLMSAPCVTALSWGASLFYCLDEVKMGLWKLLNSLFSLLVLYYKFVMFDYCIRHEIIAAYYCRGMWLTQ